MRNGRGRAWTWILLATPVVIFATGSIADVVLNSAIRGPQADRFLPEICGLVVGILTVLTFATRRQAYLAASIAFVIVEMVTITLALPIGVRAGVCTAFLATAAACLAVYVRGPWETAASGYARER